MENEFKIGEYIDTSQFGIVKVIELITYSKDFDYPVIEYNKEVYVYMYDKDIMVKAKKLLIS